MDSVAADGQLGLEPINYLVARQEQAPCEVVVLSLISTRQARMPRRRQLARPRASRPASPAAAVLGATADRLPLRPGHAALQELTVSAQLLGQFDDDAFGPARLPACYSGPITRSPV
jgi:hypothetical protein